VTVRVAVLFALGAFVLAGCGGGDPSPQSVVRAWSEAVNSEDNEGAARLFAEGARVVQGASVRRLETFAQARAWNAALPCAGRILSLSERGDTVRATFLLGNRGRSRCEGPGARALALFRVRDGKIVLWHQLESPVEQEEETV
jgi:limonene-1,2-epoxide hydrolase